MRRTPLLILAMATGVTLSCGDGPTGIADDISVQGARAIPASPLFAAGGNGAEVIWAPFEFMVEGCPGMEDVWVQGYSHTIRKEPTEGANNQHGLLTVNAQGIGVGQSTGARYLWNDKLTDYHYRVHAVGSGLKQALHSRLIGQGSAPNQRFKGMITYIVNGNGDVTVDVEEAVQVCK